jgi:hypothetical protein
MFYSVRFAPPLVISEEDLMKAVKIIAECLVDLDRVSVWQSCPSLLSFFRAVVDANFFVRSWTRSRGKW